MICTVTNHKKITKLQNPNTQKLRTSYIFFICSSPILFATMLFLVVWSPGTPAQPLYQDLSLTVPCEMSNLVGQLKLFALWTNTPDASHLYCNSRKFLTWWRNSLWESRIHQQERTLKLPWDPPLSNLRDLGDSRPTLLCHPFFPCNPTRKVFSTVADNLSQTTSQIVNPPPALGPPGNEIVKGTRQPYPFPNLRPAWAGRLLDRP